MRSLNKLRKLRNVLMGIRRRWLKFREGAVIHPDTSISLSSRLIGGRSEAIVVGERSLVAFKALLLARRPDGSVDPIKIGRHCFVGGGAVILPGVKVGDESIVAAGSVVHENVPERSIVAGNPARVIRENIEVGAFGCFTDASKNQHTYHQD